MSSWQAHRSARPVGRHESQVGQERKFDLRSRLSEIAGPAHNPRTLESSAPPMKNKNIEQAVQFAVAHETSWSRDASEWWGIHQQDPPPWNRLLGPVHSRGPVSGTIVLNGKPFLSWGEPDRADLTFSIAKTYLAL